MNDQKIAMIEDLLFYFKEYWNKHPDKKFSDVCNEIFDRITINGGTYSNLYGMKDERILLKLKEMIGGSD